MHVFVLVIWCLGNRSYTDTIVLCLWCCYWCTYLHGHRECVWRVKRRSIKVYQYISYARLIWTRGISVTYISIRVGNSPPPSLDQTKCISMQRWYRKGCTSCVYSLSILYHWRLPGPTARFEDVRLAVHSISIPRTVAHEMAVIFSFFCLTVRIANFYRIESECQNLNATNKYWSHNFSFHQTNTSLPCIHIEIIKATLKLPTRYIPHLSSIPFDYPTSKFISYIICVGIYNILLLDWLWLDGGPVCFLYRSVLDVEWYLFVAIDWAVGHTSPSPMCLCHLWLIGVSLDDSVPYIKPTRWM